MGELDDMGICATLNTFALFLRSDGDGRAGLRPL